MSVFAKKEFSAKSSGEGSRESRERDRNRRNERSSSSMKSSVNHRDRSPLDSRSRKNALEKRVYVSNIPYEYRWQDLKDLFRNEVGEVSYVELFVDENDKPRGCGIVEFESIDSAQVAVEKMHRYDLKGRKLVVKEDTNVERDKQGRSVNSGGTNRNQWGDHSTSSTSNKWGNTYGLSPQFLESLNILGPLINKVFVANLDYKVDEKKLREVFKLAGRVVSIDLLTDKDGKSRGFGTVEFEHPVEAVQAISMLHNQMLFDRRINVRMDKSNERDGPLKLPEGLKAVGMGLGANGAPLTDVARNLPSLNLSNVRPSSSLSSPSNALAALGDEMLDTYPNNECFSYLQPHRKNNSNIFYTSSSSYTGSLSQQLDNRLLDNQLTRRQFEIVGNSLINNASAADLVGIGSTPFGSNLNLNNSVSGSRAFSNVTGTHDFDAISAALNSSVNKYDYEYTNTGGAVGSLRHSDTVMISNLPSNTTWKTLREKFCDVGDLKYAEMKGKDVGIIRYGSERDAERAVSLLDRTRVDGRIIDVRLY